MRDDWEAPGFRRGEGGPGGTVPFLGRRQIIVAIVSTLVAAALIGYVATALQRASAGTVRFATKGAQLVRTVDGVLWSTRFQALPSPDAYNTNGSGSPDQDVIRWQQGLLGVGINNLTSTGFLGYFLETKRAFPADAFVQTQMDPYPVAESPNQAAETIVAVQTASTDRTGLLNYVIVSYLQLGGQQSLRIGFANGLIQGANTTILNQVAQPGLMTTVQDEPITVTTNGNNTYEAWLGNTIEYQASHLDMRIPPPFQVYLEVQAAAVDYTSYFRNLYVYRSNFVTLTDLPAGADVRLSVPSAPAYQTQVVASASGMARLVLPPMDLTAVGVLQITAHGHPWTFSPITLHGGDHYQWHRPL